MRKIAALAGGVGGAKLADGLYQVLPPENLTVIVNTGDDFDHFGLRICPDLDTVCYTLAGMANPETGWGLAGESWNSMQALERLGAPDWFHLGDRDLATHLERTRRLKNGDPLSLVTAEFCRSWGVQACILPMTDDQVATRVFTVEKGELAFQEYFVEHHCQPRVLGFRFEGIETAQPAPGVLEALEQADGIILCPSNPWVSIGPVLAVPGLLDAIARKTVIAVSPIVGGKAIKGPAAKMYQEMGFVPSVTTVASHYRSLLTGLVLDELDRDQAVSIDQSGIIPLVSQTVMRNAGDRASLANTILQFIEELIRRNH